MCFPAPCFNVSVLIAREIKILSDSRAGRLPNKHGQEPQRAKQAPYLGRSCERIQTQEHPPLPDSYASEYVLAPLIRSPSVLNDFGFHRSQVLCSFAPNIPGINTGNECKQRKGPRHYPPETTEMLKNWFKIRPYPTAVEKQDLMRQTGLRIGMCSGSFSGRLNVTHSTILLTMNFPQRTTRVVV